MKESKLIALTGILSALSVVLMFFGSVITVFAYIMPLFSGLLLISLNDFSKKYSWIMFAVVSLISLFVLADKECSLTYIFFFGYYPIIRERLERIKSKLPRYFIKLVIFNAGIILSQLLCFYVFGVPFDNVFGRWGVPILLVLANLVFVVYERLFTLLVILYNKKIKKFVIKLLK